jgi:hypothetical protein
MASELLKTFQKIEWGRQTQRAKLKSLGVNTPENISFTELATYLGEPVPAPVEHELWPGLEDIPYPWARPEGWPDPLTILNKHASPSSGTGSAFIYVLLPDTAELFIPAQYTDSYYSSGNSATLCNLGRYKGILTSDGNFYSYSSADRVATWDPSKAIEITEGRKPGKYRWVIIYYDQYSHVSPIILNRWNPYEVYINNPTTTTGTVYSPIITSTPDGGANLVNFELSDNVKGSYYVSSSSATNSSTLGISGALENLERLYFGATTQVRSTSSTSHFNSSLPRLVEISAPKATRVDMYRGWVSGSGWCFPRASYGLREIYFPALTTTATVYIYNLYNLRKFIAPAFTLAKSSIANNYTDEVHDSTFYLPEDCVYNITAFSNGYPTNWKSNHGVQANALSSKHHANLEVIDWSNGSAYRITSDSTSTTPVGEGCPKLHTIIVPKNCNIRFSLDKAVSLTKECLLDVFENMIDTTQPDKVFYNPWIRLSKKQLAMFTEEELAILTNKGWVIK